MDLRLYGCYGNEIDSLFQTVKVASEDIGMSFGIGKCVALAMDRRKEVKCNGIDSDERRAIQDISTWAYWEKGRFVGKR